MKKLILLLGHLLLYCFVFANDANYHMSGGQLIPVEETNVEVSMIEEEINIVLHDGYFEVTVDFYFYNYGDDVNLEVGFPLFCYGYGKGKIYDFKCWTNDVETSYADYPLERNWQNNTQLEKAYLRSIYFTSKEITKTRVQYKSTYGYSYSKIASYLYGTGSCWKNSIGKITVRVQNDSLINYPEYFNYSTTRVNDNTWESEFYDVEPEEYNKEFYIYVNNIFHDNGPRYLTRERYFGYTRKLEAWNLENYTKAQLRLIRNAIYAFNGYPFKSSDLINFFSEDVAWFHGKYVPNPTFSEDNLTENEKYNNKLILEEENKR